MAATKRASRYWLWIGLLAYGSIFGYSVVNGGVTYDAYGTLDVLDWLAASTPYFFMGALLGWCFDWLYARQRKMSIAAPYWVRISICFVVVSMIAGAVLATNKPIIVRLLFPLLYGIFFTVFAGETLFGGWADTIVGRSIINIIFLTAFATWLRLQAHSPNQYIRIRQILIGLILLFLTIGAVSCASQLG